MSINFQTDAQTRITLVWTIFTTARPFPYLDIVSPIDPVGVEHEVLPLPLGEDPSAHLEAIALQDEVPETTYIWGVHWEHWGGGGGG